ncbi:dockerin type I domain-containing protein [Stieleria sp. ICT_E10.1]|uniref:Ig-like domain-containing protein n=1 Tax=Stieleria sedimenti TaxID=2976331 RepID=UPI00217F5E57|nr:Ig-like domain-containing protein [Stieleria sedimenti]MCS7470237.1 dockerin type I domain-containing protein [Stieleria sedimenti]
MTALTTPRFPRWNNRLRFPSFLVASSEAQSPDRIRTFFGSKPIEADEVLVTIRSTDIFYGPVVPGNSSDSLRIRSLNAATVGFGATWLHFGRSDEPIFVRVSNDAPLQATSYELSVLVGHEIQFESETRTGNDIIRNAVELQWIHSTSRLDTQIVATATLGDPSFRDVDFFALGNRDAADTITVTTRKTEWSTGSPQIQVVDAFGGVIAQSTSGQPSSTQHLTATIPEDGKYYVKATSAGQQEADSHWLLEVGIVDRIAPQVDDVEGLPAPDATGSDFIDQFEIKFDSEIDPDSLTDEDVELLGAGPDQQFQTADDQAYHLQVQWRGPSLVAVSLINQPLADGPFRLSVSDQVRDAAGNVLAGGNGYRHTFAMDALLADEVFEGFTGDEAATAIPLPLESDPGGTGWLRSPFAAGLTEETNRGRDENQQVITDYDWWSFQGRADDVVDLVANERPLAGPTRFELAYAATDSQAVIVLEPQSPVQYPTRPQLARYVLPASGTFYVRVSSHWRSGSHISLGPVNPYSFGLRISREQDVEAYEVAATNDLNGTSTDATEIAFIGAPGSKFGSVGGTLNSDTDRDHFRLGTLNAGNQIRVDASDLPSWSPAQPQIRVYYRDADNAGSRVDLPISSDDPLVIRAEAPRETEYFVEVVQDDTFDDVLDPADGQYVLKVSITDTTPPAVTELRGLPGEGEFATHLIDAFTLVFNESVAPESVASSGITLTAFGADGVLGTTDDVPIELQVSPSDVLSRWDVRLAADPLPLGSYRFQIDGPVADLAGNALVGANGSQASPAFAREFSVVNQPDDRVIEISDREVPGLATPLQFISDNRGTGWQRSELAYGKIQSDDDVDWWQFDLQAGVRLQAIAYSLESSTRGTLYAPKLTFYQLDQGQRAEVTDAVYPSAGHYLDTFQAINDISQSGTYLVAIEQLFAGQRGDYELRLLTSDSSSTEFDFPPYYSDFSENAFAWDHVDFVASATFHGTLNSHRDEDVFPLGYLRAGDSITIEPTTVPHWSSAHPRVELRRGYTPVADQSQSDDVFFATIPADGWYSVVVDGYLSDSKSIDGQYAVDVTWQDNVAPQIVSVDGIPAAGGTQDEAVSSLTIFLSEPTNIEDVLNTAISIVGAGDDGVFQTGDDQQFEPRLDYNADDFSISVRLGDDWLSGQSYRLTVSDVIRDLAGRPLDGDGDGDMGGDSVHEFTIASLGAPYLLETPGNDDFLGATELTFEDVDRDGTGWMRTQIGLGRLQSGDSSDWWRFSVQEGDSFLIDLQPQARFIGMTAQLMRLSRDGDSVEAVSANPLFGMKQQWDNAFIAESDATYLFQLQRPGETIDIEYTISVQANRSHSIEVESDWYPNRFSTPDPSPMRFTPSESGRRGSIAGRFTGSEDLDGYYLGVLHAGSEVVLDVTSVPDWSGVTPRVTLRAEPFERNATVETVVDMAPGDGVFRGTIQTEAFYYAHLDYRTIIADDRRYTRSDDAVQWFEAFDAGYRQGAPMVSIGSARENAVLADFFGAGHFIGLWDPSKSGTFRWIDGSPLTFEAWKVGEPRSSCCPVATRYAVLADQGRWSTATSGQRTWISEQPIDQQGTPPDEPWVNVRRSAQYVLDVTIDDNVPLGIDRITGLPGEGEVLDVLLHRFAIEFSEPFDKTGVADSIELRAAGNDGQFDTDDDRIYAFDSLDSDDAESRTLRVNVADGPLTDQMHRLTLKDSLSDWAGNALDGDGDGQAGGDVVRIFDVDAVADDMVFENLASHLPENATRVRFQADTLGTGWLSSEVGRGEFNEVDNVDWWSFEARAGEHVELILEGTIESSRNQIQIGYIDDLSGDLIVLETYRGNASYQIMIPPALVVPLDTVYLVGVTALAGLPFWNTPPSYLLHVGRQTTGSIGAESTLPVEIWSHSEEPASDAEKVEKSASVAGSIFSPRHLLAGTDRDDFHLGTLHAGQHVMVDVSQTAWTDAQGFLRVFDDQGKQWHFDVISKSNRRVEWVARQSGSYRLSLDFVDGAQLDAQYLFDVSVSPPESLPDLVAESVLSKLPISVDPREPLKLSWTTANRGTETASGPWVERVYATPQITPDASLADRKLIATLTFDTQLAPGQSVNRTASVRLLQSLTQGRNYYFSVVVDAENSVTETDEQNQFIQPVSHGIARVVSTESSQQPVVFDAQSSGDLPRQIIVAGETSPEFTAGWTVNAPLFSTSGFLHHLASTRGQVMLLDNRPWTNPVRRTDVDHDGLASPRDALIVINQIGDPDWQMNDVLKAPAPGKLHHYIDVNGDGRVTPLDALIVINSIGDSAVAS